MLLQQGASRSLDGVASGEVMRKLAGHEDWVRSCAWSPNGRVLASAGDDGKVLLWDAASGEMLRALVGHESQIRACAWSPDGRLLVTAGRHGKVLLWVAASGNVLRELAGLGGGG